jgi:hypothetical protein
MPYTIAVEANERDLQASHSYQPLGCRLCRYNAEHNRARGSETQQVFAIRTSSENDRMAISPGGRGPEVLAVYSLFLVLTTIFVSLRMYCRLYIQKAFGWDDGFAAAAWVINVRPLKHVA